MREINLTFNNIALRGICKFKKQRYLIKRNSDYWVYDTIGEK